MIRASTASNNHIHNATRFFGWAVLWIVPIIFCTACQTAVGGTPQGESADNQALACPATNDRSAQIRDLIGSSYVSNGDRATRWALHCLALIWREVRDGELRNEASTAVLALLYRHPLPTLRYLESSPGFYGEWIAGLQRRSFVWGLDPPCELEDYKHRILLVLKNARERDRTVGPAIDRIVAAIGSVHCRQID